jgi:REP element-mobilizing transposase RayT
MGGLVFHVMNRGSRHGPLFESPADYDRFDWLLRTALIKGPLRRLAFCAMPNHGHLLGWPENDEQLPRSMHWSDGHARNAVADCERHGGRRRRLSGSIQGLK